MNNAHRVSLLIVGSVAIAMSMIVVVAVVPDSGVDFCMGLLCAWGMRRVDAAAEGK